MSENANQAELEDAALDKLTAEGTPEWISEGVLYVNWPDSFPSVDAARDALDRLQTQGFAERVECDGGPVWRATKRAYREAAES